jgi:hypothetical protein
MQHQFSKSCRSTPEMMVASSLEGFLIAWNFLYMLGIKMLTVISGEEMFYPQSFCLIFRIRVKSKMQCVQFSQF